MATHDADKQPTAGMKNDPNANPSDRRTMTRDPNATGGAIIENGTNKDGLTKTNAGSTHLTTNIDGRWYVCNTRGEPFNMAQPFNTESDAVAEAQRHNTDVPGLNVDRTTPQPVKAPLQEERDEQNERS